MRRIQFAAFGCVILAIWSSAAAAQELTMQRSVPGVGEYVPGEAITIRITLSFTGSLDQLTAFGIKEFFPEGWAVNELVPDSSSNDERFNPAFFNAGEEGGIPTVEMGWLNKPQSFPIFLEYTVSVPIDAVGSKTIFGNAIYRLTGPELNSPNVNTVINSLGETPEEKEEAMCGCAPSAAGATGILGDIVAGMALCGVLVLARRRGVAAMRTR